ncbi:uncharacterized protein LOC134821851 [Bolinopsis microptera]|uniref:uncharacterized protein LOC134821851 n=1 Tax=Bolinopsis microptera TaxID=2820187 RepID=UPI003079CAFB
MNIAIAIIVAMVARVSTGSGFTPVPNHGYQIKMLDGPASGYSLTANDKRNVHSRWVHTDLNDQSARWGIILKQHNGQDCYNIKSKSGPGSGKMLVVHSDKQSNGDARAMVHRAAPNVDLSFLSSYLVRKDECWSIETVSVVGGVGYRFKKSQGRSRDTYLVSRIQRQNGSYWVDVTSDMSAPILWQIDGSASSSTSSVDGGWSDYSDWGACSAGCGKGTQTRSKTCNNPPPASGGKDCGGEAVESKDCMIAECPVDGGWSDYSDWGACSAGCGKGTQTRSKTCNNPPPASGGKDCGGEAVESKDCMIAESPVDGGWSDYSKWGACSAGCGKGTQTRSKTCNNPPPARGGKDCGGEAVESKECMIAECPGVELPVERDVVIEWDLESTPLEIKSNSELGSNDNVLYVTFYSAWGMFAGGLWLDLASPLYSLQFCTSFKKFAVNPPSTADKVWRITLTRTAGVRVVVHCNEVEVLNILLSDQSCTETKWSKYWNRLVTKIKFRKADSASDYYRAQPVKRPWRSKRDSDTKQSVGGVEVTSATRKLPVHGLVAVENAGEDATEPRVLTRTQDSAQTA